MRRRTRNTVAALLAGALMAMASPAVAFAQSPPSGEPKVLSSYSIMQTPVGLRNLKSQKFLQPAGGSTGVGARIVQQTFTGAGIQAWYIVVDGSYRSFWNYTSRLNMGVDRASTAAGAAAIQANPDGHANQDWQMVFRSSTVFELKNRHSGLCLGISGASTADGAQAAQFGCDGSVNQGWQATN